jgi:hypothetical protein
MQNPFTHRTFQTASLTAAINLLPNRYGKLEALKLMPIKPARTRQIIVQERNGVLTLLPSMPPGSPGSVGVSGKRKARSFVVPHIPHDDVVLPEEVNGVVPFGVDLSNAAEVALGYLETVANVMAGKLETMRNKHAITLEHLRMGALKGVILDADGSELYDLFDEFQIQPKTISFALNVPETNVKTKCSDVLRHLEDNLRGEFMTGAHVLCSPEFFDALTSHAKVEKAYENFQNGAVLINDMRAGFNFGGLTFEEYRGQATDLEGTTRRFIAAGEAHVFPLGTIDTFATHVAPADFNESVNTLGQLLYAKQEPRKFDRGTDIHTQSNPLPMCHSPGVLITLKAGG